MPTDERTVMVQYCYFNGANCLVRTSASPTARVAAEGILAKVPAEHRWQTNVRELLSLSVGASIDLTESPVQRTIRREF